MAEKVSTLIIEANLEFAKCYSKIAHDKAPKKPDEKDEPDEKMKMKRPKPSHGHGHGGGAVVYPYPQPQYPPSNAMVMTPAICSGAGEGCKKKKGRRVVVQEAGGRLIYEECSNACSVM